MGHAFNTLKTMRLLGYDLPDMLAAFPGKDVTYLDQVLCDTAHASNRYVMPYGVLGVSACASKYFNVHPAGFRSNGEAQPWPPDPNQISIFFFGGSTTLGYCIEDSQTIPAQLQRKLVASGIAAQVYNFAAGSYTIRHESLRLLDLVDRNIVPDYVIFLDGNNESVLGLGPQALVDALDQLYQYEKERHRMSLPKAALHYVVKRVGSKAPPESPEVLVRITEDPEIEEFMRDQGIADALQASSQRLSLDQIAPAGVRLATRVWENYLNSVALVRGLASARNISTLFAWQPVLWYATTPEQRIMERLLYVFRHSVLCSPVYHWLHATSFPKMSSADDFLNLASIGQKSRQVLYVEYVHYSAAFCQLIAEALANAATSRWKFQKRQAT